MYTLWILCWLDMFDSSFKEGWSLGSRAYQTGSLRFANGGFTIRLHLSQSAFSLIEERSGPNPWLGSGQRGAVTLRFGLPFMNAKARCLRPIQGCCVLWTLSSYHKASCLEVLLLAISMERLRQDAPTSGVKPNKTLRKAALRLHRSLV